MTQNIRETFNTIFFDRDNYPYGFARSGDFSIKESQLLEEFGMLYAALADGKISPESPEEQHVLNVITGNKDAQTAVEKVWLKYQTRINRPHIAALSHKNEKIKEKEIPD